MIQTLQDTKKKEPGLKASRIGHLPLLLTWSCKAQLSKVLWGYLCMQWLISDSALTRFPGILDCLVQVFISEASILIFPLIQVLLHGAQGILHSRSCFVGLSSSCFGILDRVLCVLCKERNISEVVRSREEAPLGHSRCMKKGVERISPATPEQTLLPAQHVLHRLELGQEPLLPRTKVSQLVPCCLQSAFNSCN